MKYQGIARIRANGTEYPTAEDATLDIGGFTRQTVKGARVYGYQPRQRWSAKFLILPE